MPVSGKNVCVCTYFFTFHRRRECLNLKCKKKLCRFVFTLGPNEVSFITHSMVNSIVKTRLQSASTSMYSSGAPSYCAKNEKRILDVYRKYCKRRNESSVIINYYFVVFIKMDLTIRGQLEQNVYIMISSVPQEFLERAKSNLLIYLID